MGFVNSQHLDPRLLVVWRLAVEAFAPEAQARYTLTIGDDMLLGHRNLTAGDTRRYEVDYTDFLARGAKLTKPTGYFNTGTTFTSSLGTMALDESATKVFVFVTGGVVNEQFTLTIQVQDTFNEVVNDTITFTIVSP